MKTILTTLILLTTADIAGAVETVNISNFIRAESDMQFKGYTAKARQTDKLMYMREVYSVLFGTFVHPNDPEDVKKAQALRDQITVKQASAGMLEVPDWDVVSLKATRERLNQFVPAMPDVSKAFGAEGQVDPVQHLVGAAFGWGGNQQRGAAYFAGVPEKNDLNAYSFSSVTEKRNDEGGVNIHFGSDSSQPNYLPLTDGWNYIVRCYLPGTEIIEGDWTPSVAIPVV